MSVHVFGSDNFDDVLARLEESSPGVTKEFRGTVLELESQPFFGLPIAGSREERYSHLRDDTGKKVAVVVTSISVGAGGEVDVEVIAVCSYEDWTSGMQEAVTRRLGLE